MVESKATAEELQQRIENAMRRLKSGEDWQRWLKATATLHRYSFRNVILIMLQKPAATTVAGYRDWQKLDRQVVRGEAGIRILAPIYVLQKDAVGEDGRTPEGERTSSTPKNQPRNRRVLVGFKVTSVFDISQTVGEPLARPPVPEAVIGSAPSGLWDALAREVEADGFELSVGPTGDPTVEGYTDHLNRQIVIGDHLDGVTAVARLAHEVAHMRMHSPEEVAAAGSIMCRGAREVEAESVAYVLLTRHGMTMEGASFPYIAGWAASVDPKAPDKVLQQTGQRVVEAAQDLIESTESDGTPVRPIRRVRRDPLGLAVEADGASAEPVGPGL
ncbi:hypothetical protein EV644_13143 [Kribbella orskensis]|uniref:N-terminal domain-containing protein n=1 Tax=Kribbella orskensis TaxID=2512216 RepID=A0ABY2BA68_9ACTN|nr:MULTISPECIES: ArdC-like ssDNA-binding domain-containing protein [Kribbella]TCN30661.1 hypothetical protein EV642_13343 [Kribbella sp. VKM Ac-2500]TCO11380.1 hypothetical protein EV644_13143 [Kribbella orskensis]